MLDINLFRKEKEHDPEIIRISQRRRYKPVEIVDEVIHLDKKWRQCMFELEQLQKDFNKLNKDVAKLRTFTQDFNKLNKDVAKLRTPGGDVRAMIQDARIKKDSIEMKKEEVQAAEEARNEKLVKIRNLVDDSVPRGEDEEKGYEALQPPIFLTKYVMSKCAQLGSLEEELYKVKGDDQYLIATTGQLICASHKDDLFGPKQLPIRMSGMLDIHLAFVKRQVHMVKTLLKLPYQVVDILSGALNDATAKKYDLEAWFPASAKN
ncbi:serine--tRNA ligase [Tanacetum coccineum]